MTSIRFNFKVRFSSGIHGIFTLILSGNCNHFYSTFHREALPVTTLAKYGEDSVYTLGSTGDSIVYIFPNGQALIERNGHPDALSLPDHVETSIAKPSGSATYPDGLDQLILDSGLITAAQYSVASYDTTTTGLSLIEVLQTRGWIHSSDISRLLKTAS